MFGVEGGGRKVRGLGGGFGGGLGKRGGRRWVDCLGVKKCWRSVGGGDLGSGWDVGYRGEGLGG